MQRIALVVDDSRVARMTLKKLLRTYQFDVVELGSGEEAIDYLLTDSVRPDIIFMDVMMGGMDGLTATRRIKANPKLSGIPVIICTGNDTEEDKNKAINVGAVTALTKPPAAEALAAVLSQVESSTPEPTIELTQVEVATEPQFDEEALIATVLAAVEKTLLPNVKKEVREIAEDISQQIAGDMAENLIEAQVNAQLEKVLAEFTGTLTAKTEQVAEKTAKQACAVAVQETAMDAASQAVQLVVNEANITAQVTTFLSEKGDEWLAEQEEDLGTQLSAQLEQLIPSICAEYLDTNLATTVLPIIEEKIAASIPEPQQSGPTRDEIEGIINLSLEQHTNTELNPIVNSMVTKQLAAQTLLEQDEEALDKLTEQVSMLKNITMGLAVVVVGLLIAVIV
ncbi:MAG: response regulator [Methylophaga sp.]|nr:response regulator [Methylophaga sp.]